jgi:hypothetical protein
MIRILIDVSKDASWVAHNTVQNPAGKVVSRGRMVLGAGPPTAVDFEIFKEPKRIKVVFETLRMLVPWGARS